VSLVPRQQVVDGLGSGVRDDDPAIVVPPPKIEVQWRRPENMELTLGSERFRRTDGVGSVGATPPHAPGTTGRDRDRSGGTADA
jgi:hypothetical protein